MTTAVIRLQRPVVGSHAVGDCWLGGGSLTGQRGPALDAAAASSWSPGSGMGATTVGLPRGFGSMYRGQEFRCCIVAINAGVRGAAPALSSVEIGAELQVGDGDSAVKVSLPDERDASDGSGGHGRAAQLPAGQGVNLVVSRRIDAATSCALRVVVRWRGGDVGGRPQEYRKFYRFPVLEPMTITPVLSHPLAAEVAARMFPPPAPTSEGAVCLRLALRNASGAPLTVAEPPTFRPTSAVGHAGVVWPAGAAVCLEPGDEEGVVVVLRRGEGWSSDRASIAAGELRVSWRAAGGERAEWSSPTVLVPTRHLVPSPGAGGEALSCRMAVDGPSGLSVGDEADVRVEVTGEAGAGEAVEVRPSGVWAASGGLAPLEGQAGGRAVASADGKVSLRCVVRCRCVAAGDWRLRPSVHLDATVGARSVAVAGMDAGVLVRG